MEKLFASYLPFVLGLSKKFNRDLNRFNRFTQAAQLWRKETSSRKSSQDIEMRNVNLTKTV